MAGAEYPRQVRLLNSAQFKAVFDDSRFRVSTRELLLLARPNALEHARLGIVVGKKNCRMATWRNRVKRQVRESYRHNQPALAGLDIIVLARRGIADLDNGTITQHLTKLWNRLNRTFRESEAAPCAAPASP
jgi:ribonuclease P protein component